MNRAASRTTPRARMGHQRHLASPHGEEIMTATTIPPLLVLVLVAAQDKPAPNPPAGKAGNIDYEAELNDKLGKGITPEKNAAVLLWQALGPTPEGGPRMPAEFF